MNKIDIIELKKQIKSLKILTKKDRKILAIISSLYAYDDYFIKSYVLKAIKPYVGCKAYNMTMKYVYILN